MKTRANPGTLATLDFADLEALQGMVAEKQVEDSAGNLFVLSTAVESKAAQTPAQANNARRLLERQRPGADGMPYREIVGLGEAYRNDDLGGNRALYGDFSQLVVGVWGGPGIDVDGFLRHRGPGVSETEHRDHGLPRV